TNRGVNIAHGVTTANTQATTVNSTTIDNLSDAVIYSFFASQQNSPHIDNKDLQPIHLTDLEEMDLKWQMAMLIIKAKRFLKNSGRKFSMNGTKTIRESTGRTVPVETPASSALVSCDRLGGYDWSDQAQDGPLVLMAYSTISSNSEIADKCKAGLGYNAIPPPYTRNFLPPKPNLSGLEEFVDKPKVKKPKVETSDAKASEDKPKVEKKIFGPLLIEDWISDSEDETKPKPKTERKTVKPSFAKIEFVKSKEQVKTSRKTTDNQHRQHTYKPRGNKRNWNRMMSQRLGSNFEMYNKACYECVNAARKKFSKAAVTINAARLVNTAHPKTIINAVKPRPKPVLNAIKGNMVYVVKASTCWVWKPKTKVIDHVSKHNSASITLNKFDYVDAQDYEEINRGYVAFRGNLKGGKIIGKGTIKSGELDFENVYFVKELKFNLFSVSQICDKKNSVLFNDTECVVLSPDFKLTDENYVLHRVPRKNNMYSVDLKNIIPKEDHLGKFDGKDDEVFFVGYSLKSKACRVYNSRTRIVEETLHIRFSKNTPNNVGSRPNWLFNIDALTKTMNYQPVVVGTQCNGNAGTKDDNNAGQARKPKSSQDDGFKPYNDVGKKVNKVTRQENECKDQVKKDSVNNTNRVNAVSSTINAASNEVNAVGRKSSIDLPDDPNMPELEDISIFEDSNKDVFGAEADLTTWNLLFKFEDPDFPDKVYKVEKALYRLNQAPRAWPDIMFAVCAYARYQVNPKVSHLHLVKRIFRYLKGQLKLGLWYLKDSPFNLMAYTDGDYAGASLDRKSTTGGFQFFGCRLISRQYKKQTIVANFTAKAEYVNASSCCGQFWTIAKSKIVNEEVQIHALVDGMKDMRKFMKD
nr:ribonuclease H-like domain-containing protein [Tanacetum cinerariifolium]